MKAVTKVRKFQVYEECPDGTFWRTVCEHADGKRNTSYNEQEARAYCKQLKQQGTKYKVYEQIEVTNEF